MDKKSLSPEVNEGFFARIGSNTLLGVVCLAFAMCVAIVGAIVVGFIFTLFVSIAGMGMGMPPSPPPLKFGYTWPWIVILGAAILFFAFAVRRLWQTRPQRNDHTLV